MNFVKRITFLFLLCTLFIGVSTKGFTQGNLQFNQVITHQGVLDVTLGNGPCNFCGAFSPEWTVPTGKIWKIESVSSSTATVSTCGTGFLLRNGMSLKESVGVIYAKSGDILKFYYNNGSCNGYGTYTYSISVIEFNIIP
jgi:hypothetical protein